MRTRIMLFLALGLSACSASPATTSTPPTPETSHASPPAPARPASSAPSAPAGTTREVQFTAGRVVELALLSVKEGMGPQFQTEYFPQASQIAQEYGGQLLAVFEVTDVPYGWKRPQTAVLFEWASMERKRAFARDPRFLQIQGLRDNALEYLAQGYFTVEENRTLSLVRDGEGTYELILFWMDPDHADDLNTYFSRVGPVAAQPEYGGFEMVQSFTPLRVNDGTVHPDMFALGRWNSLQGSRAFFELPIYQENVHLREAAAPYKDVLQVRFVP